MNLTNFKFFEKDDLSDIRSLHIDRAHIVAIEETKLGTRIYTTSGHTFAVREGIESVREHLYSDDFWPETYKEQTFVRRRKPYSTEFEYVPA